MHLGYREQIKTAELSIERRNVLKAEASAILGRAMPSIIFAADADLYRAFPIVQQRVSRFADRRA